MRFVEVHVTDPIELETYRGTKQLEADETYGFPEIRGKKLATTNNELDIQGTYTVPDEEVKERFGEVVDGDQEKEPAYADLVESSSNADIEEEVQDFEDIAELTALLETEKQLKNRKGAKEAIKDRIGELED